MVLYIDKDLVRAKQVQGILGKAHYEAATYSLSMPEPEELAEPLFRCFLMGDGADGYMETVRMAHPGIAVGILGKNVPLTAAGILAWVEQSLSGVQAYEMVCRYRREAETRVAELEKRVAEQEVYLAKAGALQRGMLKARQYPGIRIEAQYHPLGRLSGDFYYYKMFGKKLLFMVGDVTDHGAEAALYMTELMSFLRALCQKEPDFLEFLSTFNHLACKYNPSGMQASVFFGLLDVDTGELTYCNAGHEPPFLIHPSGKMERLAHEQPNLQVGALDGFEYRTDKAEVPKCGKLFLYTDGITEEFNSRGKDLKYAYGEERLARVLAEVGGMSAVAVCASVTQDVFSFISGCKRNDDILVMCIERTEEKEEEE